MHYTLYLLMMKGQLRYEMTCKVLVGQRESHEVVAARRRWGPPKEKEV